MKARHPLGRWKIDHALERSGNSAVKPRMNISEAGDQRPFAVRIADTEVVCLAAGVTSASGRRISRSRDFEANTPKYSSTVHFHGGYAAEVGDLVRILDLHHVGRPPVQRTGKPRSG